VTGLLFIDTEEGGHRANYFNCFIEYAASHPDAGKVIFAISQRLLERLEPRWRQCVEAGDGRLVLRRLTGPELARANQPGPEVRRNFARWKLAMAIAREMRATHIHFPLADDIMKAASVMPGTPYRISGIYFRPTTHFLENWRGVKGYLRQWGKRFFLKRFLARPDTIALLSFDSWFTDFARAGSGGDKVYALPEPIDPASAVLLVPRQSGGRVRFLFFGALQARKGLPELLEALPLLSTATLERTSFAVCGEGELSGLVREKLPKLRHGGVCLRFDNRFLSESELETEFARADVFLAPYRNHIGSSGAIYVAAQYRKPVITQDWGLIGRQVRRHRLGAAIDTTDPARIAAAIEAMTLLIENGRDDTADYDGLVRGQGRKAFAQAVFEWGMAR
jgi:glycosyltransferase involved in cell wall biosynthesis